MHKSIRIFLDWLQIPSTILFILKMNKKDRELAWQFFENWKSEWRKNSVPVKIERLVLKIASRRDAKK